MADTNINKKILEKLKKFATSEEISMCEQILNLELRWHGIEEPPFKRDFAQLLAHHFPFEGEKNHV